MRKVGSRVAAICSATEEKAIIFGKGTYIGDQVPPKGIGEFTDLLNEAGITNPTIKLDDGNLVYGCECWWGPEEILDKYPAFETISILDRRKEYMKTND